jgi:hypothetical protein
MEISRGSLAIALTLSLLILCSGCAATQQIRATIQDQLREMRGLMAQPGERDGPPAGILPGTHLVTIPPGTAVVPGATKPVAGVP